MKNCILILLLTATISHSYAAAPALSLQFVNNTAGEQASTNIWVNFANGGLPTINVANGNVTYDAAGILGTANIWNTMTNSYVTTNITTNSSFQLSTIENGIFSIAGFGGGRTYVSYGSALSSYNPVIGPFPGWQPAPALPPDNFTTRFQAFELTTQAIVEQSSPGVYQFSNTNSLFANLSYIDQVSISTGISILNAPSGTTNPTQTSVNTKALVDAVAVYNTNAASSSTFTAGTNVITASTGTQYYQVAGESSPASYQNPGSTSIASPAPDLAGLTNFVRVAGPGQMPPVGNNDGDTSLYHTWDNYIAALSPGGALHTIFPTTQITGSYGPANVPAQPYTGNASFHNGIITLGLVDYTGYVIIENFIFDGLGQPDIYIPYASLNQATGLYGTNPSYSIGTAALITVPGNTLETRVVGDIVAGMNFGLLGSTVIQTLFPGIMIGNLTSEEWWALGNYNNGSFLFGGAQSNSDYYNTYAASLQYLTSAYAFGIQDRLGTNTTQFNFTSSDNPTLQFLIQPDIAPVPEPSAIGLIGIGAIVLALRFRARRLNQ